MTNQCLEKILIFGAGWMGRRFSHYLNEIGRPCSLSHADITDSSQVAEAIEEHKPQIIINCAARTGRPNVDACEKDPTGVYRSNLFGAWVLAQMAHEHGFYLVQLSSGCIFNSTSEHQQFSEKHPPNFLGNTYLHSKILAETVCLSLGALILRVRMPLSSEAHPRNLLTKLLSFKEVIREANSITILEDFFPAALTLIDQRATGVFHMVNPGIEYHDDLLNLYRDLIDPNHTFGLVNTTELGRSQKTGRSNCLLDASKSKALGAGMPALEESLPQIIKSYR